MLFKKKKLGGSRTRKTEEEIENIAKTWKEKGQTLGIKGVAELLNVSKDTVYKYRNHQTQVSGSIEEYEEKCNESKGVTDVTFLCDKKITTLEDALEFAKVDLSVWCVEKWSCGGWQVPIKVKRGYDKSGRRLPDQPYVKQMWKVRLELKRILPKSYIDATEAILERIKDHAPKYDFKRKPVINPHLLEIDLFDVHFGKLAWKPETGQNYNLDIAYKSVVNAVGDILNYTGAFEIDQIILPIGNDFYHIDNLEGTTTAGTRQDTDSRYMKIIETGQLALIWSIERLLNIAPVHIMWVPGNHDWLASYHLVRFLTGWFRNANGFTVDSSRMSRKYYTYGSNLIGFTHGNGEDHRALPTIMATENRKSWSEAKYCEWHIGHFHKSKRMLTTPVDTHEGVTIRVLQSLSGRDAWHYSKGYIGGRRVAEAFLMSKEGGLVANYHAAADQDED